MEQDRIRDIISRALEEDIGEGDVTTSAIVAPEAVVSGRFVAKEGGVVAGLEVADMTFIVVDDQIRFTARVKDGSRTEPGQVLATVEGPGRRVLAAERVALNFLQRMSGIATMTRVFADAVRGTRAIILDTRKTAPGLRVLDKWAVRLGGGENHRMGLYDMVLIKENHITVAGGVAEAVRRVRAMVGAKPLVEVEVKNIGEFKEALTLNVDRILLDNMSLEELAEAGRLAGGNVRLEASGNITLGNVAAVAAAGIDYISVGSLTHSVRALDITFLVDPPHNSKNIDTLK